MTDSAASPWSAQAFERRYAADPDPWGFSVSSYERARYATTMQALQRPRYRSAFEPGCSIGELTALLAPRCDRLVAMDVSPTALARAAERHGSLANVEWREGSLDGDLPGAPLDLVVLSEVGYYFSASELAHVVEQLLARFDREVEVLAVHWLGESADHRLHGDEVHDVLMRGLRGTLELTRSERHEGFRLDGWTR